MKNSNYISEKVFDTNLKYVQLQNKTKELFFKCLEEGRDVDYFRAQVKKIWNNIDYSYMQDDIEEYEALMHKINTGQELTPEEKKTITPVMALIGIGVIKAVDDKFTDVKIKEYSTAKNSYGYKTAKDEYLKLKVKKYSNQTVPYYSKSGELVRYVQPSTYDSMIHNTNLTRAGWNTTLFDADEMEQEEFYIPGHSFSCPECIEHQNRVMTKREVERLIGDAEEGDTELLHPNCKCVLTFYTGNKLKKMSKKEMAKAEEEYNIRQKTNTLTLRKEELLTDIKIQKSLGNQDEVDKLNSQRNRINKEIRELKEALPTEELRKQVVAINR